MRSSSCASSRLVWQHGLVLRREYLVRQAFQRVVCFGRTFFGAQDQADRRILAGLHPVLARVVQIEVHLSGVGVAELADLEVDDDEALQTPMEEQQVDAEPRVVDSQSALATDEGEVVAEFQQEVGQVLDQRLLQVGLRVLVLEVEELEHERVVNRLLWRRRSPGCTQQLS